MHVTARVDYALQAMVALAGSDASTVPTNALAEKLDLSYNYLLTIVAELRRAGFVKMRRGPAGGLQLARPAHTITLSEIVCAIDGPSHWRTGPSRPPPPTRTRVASCRHCGSPLTKPCWTCLRG